MLYNILFLDIDGTILMPDHTYTSSTKDAINQIKDQGIEVFLATGRPIHEIKDLAEELGIDSFIGYNGACAIYQNQTIVNEPLNQNTVAQFLKIAEREGHEIVFYTNEKNYFTTLNTPEVKQFINTFQMKQNHLFIQDVADHILGGTIINMNEEKVHQYEIETDIHLSQVNVESVRHSYDIIRTTVNKGEAIRRVLKQLDIPKENAIAFGDGMNDKEMLQAVGTGFAMGNANPDLFAYAKYRTTSVNDSGIFEGLKRLGLVRR